VSKGKEGKEPPNEDIEADLQVSASAFEALERDFQEVGLLPYRCWLNSFSHLPWTFSHVGAGRLDG
jgi:hypothetical protein